MSRYLQMGVYGICAAILIVDGFRTLFHHYNIFYQKDGLQPLPTGFLLIGAGGTVTMFALRALFHYAWADNAMWFFIFFSMVMMVWLIIGMERKK